MSTRDQLRAAIDRLPDDRLAELLAVAQRLGECAPEPDAAPPAKFADLLGFAADLPDAPPDLAAQHDHYLYGAPKR